MEPGTLVTVQVAVSCVLLIASAMMIAGMQGTLLREPGFRVDNLLLTGMDPRAPGNTRPFYDRLLERARVLPGVRSAALASVVPTANDAIRFSRVAPEGFVPPPGQPDPNVFVTVVSEDYFETAGIPLLSGRSFTRDDDANAPRVAVVNQLFADRYWPGQDAVGKRFRQREHMIEIVGVARGIKYIFFGEPPRAAVYRPFRQDGPGRFTLLAHTAGDPTALAAPVRALIHELAPGVPLFHLRSMADYNWRRTVHIVNMLVKTVSTLGALGLTLAWWASTEQCRIRSHAAKGNRHPLAIGAAPRHHTGPRAPPGRMDGWHRYRHRDRRWHCRARAWNRASSESRSPTRPYSSSFRCCSLRPWPPVGFPPVAPHRRSRRRRYGASNYHGYFFFAISSLMIRVNSATNGPPRVSKFSFVM